MSSPPEAWQPPHLRVHRSEQRFPVRLVYCVGRNYAAHAREMGADPRRDPPCFFTKPSPSVVQTAQLRYPPATADLQPEVELVLALHQELRAAPASACTEAIWAYAVGLDLTRRDLQAAAKARRWPWALAKGFEAAAPVSELATANTIGHPRAGCIRLWVNDQLRQEGDVSQMILDPEQLLMELSRRVTLRPGDLVFTGTPAGVGPVEVGDRLHAEIDGLPALDAEIAPRVGAG